MDRNCVFILAFSCPGSSPRPLDISADGESTLSGDLAIMVEVLEDFSDIVTVLQAFAM
eukprot:XP_001708056.1 Hypothetical protein GL50803_23818 [Giardia lamblia ATCC 50803]